MEELLSLKWNNHRSTFLHILTILRDKQLYTDATLACEGRFYSVHRLVLSTCSDYFSAMFDRTTCKNPIIVLKDIKCEDLEALLDYMYLGEVNVRQADLASLIKAAECLRVKGLAVPDDEPPPKRGRGDTNFRKPDSAGSPPSKRKRREEGTQDGREDIRPAPAQPKVGSQSQASRLSPGPQDPSDSSKLQPQTTSSSSADMLQPNNVPQSDEQQSPFVKVEMEDSGGDDMGGGGVGADNSFNMNNDSFKEEASEDHVGDLSNDLPEFLQQSTDGSYSHSFAGPSFQPDLPNWQGDQVLSSNNFSGLGFPSQSQDGSQNTGTSGGLLHCPPSSSSSCSSSQQLHQQQQEATQQQQQQQQQLSGPLQPLPLPGLLSPSRSSLKTALSLSYFYQDRLSSYNASLDRLCGVCFKEFPGRNWKQDLARHKMTHTGEKPFACPHCPHRTNHKSSLRKHIFSRHPSLS